MCVSVDYSGFQRRPDSTALKTPPNRRVSIITISCPGCVARYIRVRGTPWPHLLPKKRRIQHPANPVLHLMAPQMYGVLPLRILINTNSFAIHSLQREHDIGSSLRFLILQFQQQERRFSHLTLHTIVVKMVATTHQGSRKWFYTALSSTLHLPVSC